MHATHLIKLTLRRRKHAIFALESIARGQVAIFVSIYTKSKYARISSYSVPHQSTRLRRWHEFPRLCRAIAISEIRQKSKKGLGGRERRWSRTTTMTNDTGGPCTSSSAGGGGGGGDGSIVHQTMKKATSIDHVTTKSSPEGRKSAPAFSKKRLCPCPERVFSSFVLLLRFFPLQCESFPAIFYPPSPTCFDYESEGAERFSQKQRFPHVLFPSEYDNSLFRRRIPLTASQKCVEPSIHISFFPPSRCMSLGYAVLRMRSSNV